MPELFSLRKYNSPAYMTTGLGDWTPATTKQLKYFSVLRTLLS